MNTAEAWRACPGSQPASPTRAPMLPSHSGHQCSLLPPAGALVLVAWSLQKRSLLREASPTTRSFLSHVIFTNSILWNRLHVLQEFRVGEWSRTAKAIMGGNWFHGVGLWKLGRNREAGGNGLEVYRVCDHKNYSEHSGHHCLIHSPAFEI